MTKLTRSDNNNLEKDRSNADEHVGIVIPCKVEDFGEFLAGLISKPQTIEGEVEGVFEIHYNEISNVYHLIDQRIKEQNDGSLAHFEVKVVYDNGTSISHKTVNEFESYYPTVPGKPEEIVVSFNYLIKFKNRKIPEKQEIEITFSTAPNKSDNRTKWYAGGVIEWRISHTERTWASDMNALLKNHANSCVESSSGLWKWLRRYYEEVSHYFGTAVLMAVLISWLFSSFKFLNTSPSTIQMAKYYTVSIAVLGSLYIVIGTLIRTITLYLIVKKESFICLIDKDEEYMKKQKAKSTRRLIIYIGSFALTIASGIIANIIYNMDWAMGK